jgi:hypothetical protein
MAIRVSGTPSLIKMALSSSNDALIRDFITAAAAGCCAVADTTSIATLLLPS